MCFDSVLLTPVVSSLLAADKACMHVTVHFGGDQHSPVLPALALTCISSLQLTLQ